MKKTLGVRKQFKEAKNHLFKIRYYFVFSVLIFLLFAVFAYYNASSLKFLDVLLKDLIYKTYNLDGFHLTFFILQNNLKVSFLITVLGLFFGIFPLITSMGNGILLGYVLNLVGIGEFWRLIPHGIFELPAIFISSALGLYFGMGGVKVYFEYYSKRKNEWFYSFLFPLILFLIFEILFGMFFGTKIGVSSLFFGVLILIGLQLIMNKDLRKKGKAYFKENFYNSLNVFLMIVVPLLIIAAVVEGILIVFFG